MPAIGDSIGSYQILRLLGTGAMGEVYLAEHRHLKRKAAVKLLAPELVGRPDLLERFFLEARATSAIAHPGIVQVFDCEVDATGRPYIVMEYLEGQTLAALLAERGPLPGPTAARLARGMAEALEAAHAKGIIHRDLKPENIFVQATPPDSVKLVDFGIAKLAGDFRAGQVHQTRSGALMGTPLYMSPEQCRDSAAIDFRTDIYSMGCVLYEMLAGRPPFSKDNFGELMVAHLTEAPPDARAVNPAVPAPLAELAGELLRKDPTQRPASMRAVAERLQKYVASMTTVPGPGSALSAAAADAPPVTAPPPAAGAVRTTFGAAASEVAATADVAARSRSGAKIGAAVAGVAAIAVVAALVLERSPAPAAPAVAAAPAAPTPAPAAPPPAVAAAPAPAPAAPPPAVAAAPAAPAPAAAPPPAAPAAPPPAAAAPAAATLPAVADGPSAAAAGKKKGAHHGAALAEASPPPAGAPAPPPSAAAAPASRSGGG